MSCFDIAMLLHELYHILLVLLTYVKGAVNIFGISILFGLYFVSGSMSMTSHCCSFNAIDMSSSLIRTTRKLLAVEEGTRVLVTKIGLGWQWLRFDFNIEHRIRNLVMSGRNGIGL